jgi:hypothetical protein
MDQAEFEKFMNYYYQSPSPERATEAMRHYTATVMQAYPNTLVPTAYFFARLAQESPKLKLDYAELIEGAEVKGRQFIEEILSELNATPPGPINALKRVVRTPTDNDLLWSEFALTGNTEPVIRLIDLFERPDKIRRKLDDWLLLPQSTIGHFLGASRRRRSRCERIRTVVGIVCDAERQRITSRDDLDCLCLLHQGNFVNRDRLNEVCQLLQYPLSNEEFIYMAVKATAKWSLTGSAAQHDIVLSTIENEIGNRQDRARLTLLEIAASVRLEQNETEIAGKWLREFLQINPVRSDLAAKLAPIDASDQLDNLILLDEAVSELARHVEPIGNIALECAKNSGAKQSFFSRVSLGIRKGPEYDAAKDQPFIEWNGEYKSPSDFHVTQWMDPDDWDAWISMGQHSYQNAGIWFDCKDKGQKSTLAAVNKLIKGTIWHKILKRETPLTSAVRAYNGERYLLLEYKTSRLNSIFSNYFPAEIQMNDASTEAKLWIDLESNLLTKGEAILKDVQGEDGVFHFFFRQAFASYDAPIVIEKPELMVAPPGMDLEEGAEIEFHQVPSQSKLFDAETKSGEE